MKSAIELDILIGQLKSHDGSEREHARNAIVRIGAPAVPVLVRLLKSPHELMRWEACKALGAINVPEVAQPLVEALRDENMEVRWLAAEGLAALGRDGLSALFRALEFHFNSIFLLEGAHHVLLALEKKKLLNKESEDVLESLRHLEPRVSVPVAARRALESLKKNLTSNVGAHHL